MALEAPLRSSAGYPMSAFSPHSEMSVSSLDSSSPAKSRPVSSSLEPETNTLHPNSFTGPSPIHLMSPISDIVGPSPVTSNGTVTTEIEDDISDDQALLQEPMHNTPSLMMLKTNIPDSVRRSTSEEVISVIHAPQSFHSWKSNESSTVKFPGPSSTGLDGNPSPPGSEQTVEAHSPPTGPEPPAYPTLNTRIKPANFGLDAMTPQAQNLQDVILETGRLRPTSASSLELIPESREAEEESDDYNSRRGMFSPPFREEEAEIQALWTALEECWTLCNTLANLSSIHRVRVFNSTGTPDAHERAWKSCWKLCKRLYNSRDDVTESYNVRKNLDLCRDFCQSLFDVRQRNDGVADSVLRVSFELNNHLYSAQDSRNLPEAFRERTLDFYITLCHRLMKQRSEFAEETDSLLRACWGLAEMLFSLRQSKRDGKAPDEELLGSAVQACWELCDIFREGWTQVRPDRNTPRPSHIGFFSQGMGFNSPPSGQDRHQIQDRHQAQLMQSEARSNAGSRASVHSKHSVKRDSFRSLSEVSSERVQRLPRPTVPETPVTEFEDTPISPESASPQIPNIMVLGTSGMSDSRSAGRGGWSSSASNLSGYSQGSQKTSSTATTATAAIEDLNVTRIKVLVLKAALNIGFNRDKAPSDAQGELGHLQTFVKSLPTGSFGSFPAHATLLQNYKNLVLTDAAFRATPNASLPARGKKVHAQELAKSVGWMALRSQGQYGFLKDLFKLVMGFQCEEVDTKKNIAITI